MFSKITRYTPEMFITDRQGTITERQRAYAEKVARMKKRELKEDDNILMFTIYGSRKVCGGYSYTEYIFRPATWETRQYSATDNATKLTRYAYD